MCGLSAASTVVCVRRFLLYMRVTRTLSVDRKEALVTLVAPRTDVGGSLLLHVRVDGVLGRPAVLLQYDTPPQTDAVRAAALAPPPFSVRDDEGVRACAHEACVWARGVRVRTRRVCGHEACLRARDVRACGHDLSVRDDVGVHVCAHEAWCTCV